jgi:transcriptional regulator of acetoin/glycerol metabolism
MGAVESAAVSAGGGRIEVQHLPAEIREAIDGATLPRYRAPQDESDERERIQRALEKADGSLTRTAELLGMSRTTLWRKVRAYDMNPVTATPPMGSQIPLPERD